MDEEVGEKAFWEERCWRHMKSSSAPSDNEAGAVCGAEAISTDLRL